MERGRLVKCLALDPKGVRIATGSFDNQVRLWDFGGMASRIKPCREFEAQEGEYCKNGG